MPLHDLFLMFHRCIASSSLVETLSDSSSLSSLPPSPVLPTALAAGIYDPHSTACDIGHAATLSSNDLEAAGLHETAGLDMEVGAHISVVISFLSLTVSKLAVVDAPLSNFSKTSTPEAEPFSGYRYQLFLLRSRLEGAVSFIRQTFPGLTSRIEQIRDDCEGLCRRLPFMEITPLPVPPRTVFELSSLASFAGIVPKHCVYLYPVLVSLLSLSIHRFSCFLPAGCYGASSSSFPHAFTLDLRS